MYFLLLKHYWKHVKSYIRDGIDFLNKCDRKTDGNIVIASFDVVYLQTNIPHTFGMEAVRYFLWKYKEDIHPRFHIPFILESIDFTLKSNACLPLTMNAFHKFKVLTMGTVFARTYTSLNMGSLNLSFIVLLNSITTLKSGNTSWKTGKDSPVI